MLRNTLFSFGLAFQNIRTNLFHTVLSVLGIVIGVAALVSILSFIDGLEHYVQEQITQTTGLNSIVVQSDAYERVDGVRIKKDSFALLDDQAYAALLNDVDNVSRSALFTSSPAGVQVDTVTKTIGAILRATTPVKLEDSIVLAGRILTDEDLTAAKPVALVNQKLAKQALGHERYAEILDKKLEAKDRSLTIVGVVKTEGEDDRPQVGFPISLLSQEELKKSPPMCMIEIEGVEQVTEAKKKLEANIKEYFPERHEDLKLITNDFRLDQASKGFLLFRIIMGLIVGISIVVGGVGVMNVLLISVNERTTEIGIRKAVGAKRRDIMRQFLAESITVSAFGSFMGLIVGILATMIIVPIIKLLTELPFEAVYTLNTFITISVIAVLVGVIFGTYPAMKASKLDPVEAIRRE